MNKYVVGDIHGNYNALEQVLKQSKFDYEKDQMIIIGDVVDGYKNTYEVVEELLKIKNRIFIYGNHDLWLKQYLKDGFNEEIWLSQGGNETLESYRSHGYTNENFPKSHRDFFDSGVYWYETDGMMFVHGGFDYPKHPRDCDIQDLVWDRRFIERMKCGLKIKEWKKIFVGHTTTENENKRCAPLRINYYGEDFAKLVQLDCGAGWSGRLCLYNINTEEHFLSDFANELNGGSRGR